MANYEKLHELILLVTRATETHHYARAEKLFRQLLQEAFETKNNYVIAKVSKAFIECRRRRVLEVLEIIKHIDPIQSQRKELS